MLSWEQIGSGAMLSRAVGGIAGGQAGLRHARVDQGRRAGDDEADPPGDPARPSRVAEVNRRSVQQYGPAAHYFILGTHACLNKCLGCRRASLKSSAAWNLRHCQPSTPNRSRPKTEVGSYFVANYPPFSVWSPDHLPAIEHALDTKPTDRTRRWGCTCTSRSAASAASSATSASTPTRTPTRSRRTSSALSREIDLYAGRDGLRGPAVRVRLLRRRHAVVPVQRAAQAPDRPHQRELALGRGQGSHVRVRAGHAQGVQAPDDQGDRRHAAVASASSTSTTRSCRSTAGRTSRRRSSGRTSGRARSASRRSTST